MDLSEIKKNEKFVQNYYRLTGISIEYAPDSHIQRVAEAHPEWLEKVTEDSWTTFDKLSKRAGRKSIATLDLEK